MILKKKESPKSIVGHILKIRSDEREKALGREISSADAIRNTLAILHCILM